MKKIALSLLALALVGACGNQQPAGETAKLVFATDSTWPPMEYIDENGNLVGFDIDMVRAAAEAGGFEVEFKSVAWDGIFAGLQNEAYDAVVSSVTITEERRANMDFSVPYINAGQVLVVAKDSTTASMADLSGKSVGAQIGTTGAIEAAKYADVELKTFDEAGMAIEALVNGVIDAVIIDTPVAANFALQREEYKEKLKIVGEVMTEENYGVAVNKGNTAALELINKGIEAIIANGKLAELKAQWGLK